MTRSNAVPPPEEPRPRWHYFFFLLTGCNLLAIGLCSYLNHRLAGLYNESIRVNRAWEAQQAENLDLRQLAAAVNAPGNSVFESHDPDSEAQKMRAALRAFNGALAATRANLRHTPRPDVAELMLADLDQSDTAAQAMAKEAEQTFANFRRN